MVAPTTRWLYAQVSGLGMVVFECPEGTHDLIVKAHKITHVSVQESKQQANAVDIRLEKAGAYGVGLMQDPVNIPWSSIAWLCVAPGRLATAAVDAWSTIKTAPAGALHAIDARRNGKGGR